MMERLSLSDMDCGIFWILLRSVTIFSAWLMKISPSGNLTDVPACQRA